MENKKCHKCNYNIGKYEYNRQETIIVYSDNKYALYHFNSSSPLQNNVSGCFDITNINNSNGIDLTYALEYDGDDSIKSLKDYKIEPWEYLDKDKNIKFQQNLIFFMNLTTCCQCTNKYNSDKMIFILVTNTNTFHMYHNKCLLANKKILDDTIITNIIPLKMDTDMKNIIKLCNNFVNNKYTSDNKIITVSQIKHLHVCKCCKLLIYDPTFVLLYSNANDYIKIHHDCIVNFWKKENKQYCGYILCNTENDIPKIDNIIFEESKKIFNQKLMCCSVCDNIVNPRTGRVLYVLYKNNNDYDLSHKTCMSSIRGFGGDTYIGITRWNCKYSYSTPTTTCKYDPKDLVLWKDMDKRKQRTCKASLTKFKQKYAKVKKI